jgi:tripartite-type tricarboxylate transporter receptor subunit TctC
MFHFRGALCASIAMLASTSHAGDAGYPLRPVRVIVAQSAGSATDTAARIIAQRMGALLGQQFVVDNRPGAGGLIGADTVAKATPDGYTLLFANISTHGVNPALYTKLPYDPVKDFAPISLATITPNVLVVHPSIPAKSTKELIAHIKSHPGKLNVATPGTGSSQHLATELFKAMAGGLNTVHVPFKGGGPAITAVIAGEAAWMIPTMPLAKSHVSAQKLRAIAVTSPKRLEELPELPTVAETLPGYEVVSWFGFVAPAGTPAAIVARLNDATSKVLATPDARKSLAGVGMTAETSTPAQFAAFMRAELDKWRKVAREAQVQLD